MRTRIGFGAVLLAVVAMAGSVGAQELGGTVNTVPNPTTYAMAWRTASQRDGVRLSRPATATAVSCPR